MNGMREDGHIPVMPADLLPHALAAKGFMPPDEGDVLHRWAPVSYTHLTLPTNREV